MLDTALVAAAVELFELCGGTGGAGDEADEEDSGLGDLFSREEELADDIIWDYLAAAAAAAIASSEVPAHGGSSKQQVHPG